MQRALVFALVLVPPSFVALCGQDPLPAAATTADSASNQDSGGNTGDSSWVRAWMKIPAKARDWQHVPSGATLTLTNYGSSRSRIVGSFRKRGYESSTLKQLFAWPSQF
jgi:hypothetical protein